METADAAGMGKTYTVGALNELLTETWRQEPGRRITLEARVAAYVGGEQQAVSAISYVDVTPYGPAFVVQLHVARGVQFLQFVLVLGIINLFYGLLFPKA